MKSRHAAVTTLFVVVALGAGSARAGDQNVLRNGGFEEDLGTTWVRRSPEKEPCTFSREEAARSGRWGLLLENRLPAYNRVRQGSDRSLHLTPGSMVELSAWVKPELEADGVASVQLYCMGPGDQILAQPTARVRAARGDWEALRLLAEIPEGTEYSMVYVQAQGAAGRVAFDDLRLREVRAPRLKTPLPKVALVTDLPDDDPAAKNIRLLLDSEIVPLGQAADAVVLLRESALSPDMAAAFLELAQRGGRVFIDLRGFAGWRNLATKRVRLEANAAEDAPPATRKMTVGLRVVRESPILAGFEPGQTIPYASREGQLLVLAKPAAEGLEVLAQTADGHPAVVRLAVGKGQIVAGDVLSLDEPDHNNVCAYYKYLLPANTLGAPGQTALPEYYSRKLTYAEMVVAMQELGRALPAIRVEDEGPACGDYHIWSLNLGRPGAPLYFLYAAAHGSEWEPGYGLMTFAKRLAQGRVAGVDLDKVAVKIVPVLNPSGYDLRQRKNAHGVDLNRQGDQSWAEYGGRRRPDGAPYGPAASDWKGDAPFCEPEAQVYRRIAARKDLYCVLDFHGNSTAGNNKLAILPFTAAEENIVRGNDLVWLVNQRLRRRYLLRQSQEKDFAPYVIERVYGDANRPVLINTSARGRYGVLVELTAGYPDTYGTVLQTEVTATICQALFEAFAPPAK